MVMECRISLLPRSGPFASRRRRGHRPRRPRRPHLTIRRNRRQSTGINQMPKLYKCI